MSKKNTLKKYKVTVKRCGEAFAEVFTTAYNPLAACQAAEKKLNVKYLRCQISEGKKVRTVFWSGLDLEARVI